MMNPNVIAMAIVMGTATCQLSSKDQADKKEDQAENEKDWKGSEYVRDI